MLGFATGLLAFLLKIGFGGIVEKTIGYMQEKAKRQNDAKRIEAEVMVEHIRQAVEETRIMAKIESQKLGNPIFWFFLALFIIPLGVFWTAVIADSVYQFPNWNVAALPPPLDDWAARMIAWLFFTGRWAS